MEWANPESEATDPRIEEYLDEMLKETFPASDPSSTWSGRDSRPIGAEKTQQKGEARGPVSVGDDSRTLHDCGETDAMEGPAPMG
jgi:hypothetical protein